MRQIDDALCNENFRKFIIEGREAKGLYQADVAEKLGMSQAQYSYLENGHRKITLTMAINICLVLGLDFNDFVKTYIDDEGSTLQ